MLRIHSGFWIIIILLLSKYSSVLPPVKNDLFGNRDFTGCYLFIMVKENFILTVRDILLPIKIRMVYKNVFIVSFIELWLYPFCIVYLTINVLIRMNLTKVFTIHLLFSIFKVYHDLHKIFDLILLKTISWPRNHPPPSLGLIFGGKYYSFSTCTGLYPTGSFNIYLTLPNIQ